MRLQAMRSGAAALAMSVTLAGAAVAQTQPAQPAAPGAPAAQGQAAPAPPSKVDLVSPEPQWAKFCAKQPGNNKDACATMRDFSTSADQPPMISVNVFDVAGEERRKLRFLIMPIGMMLKPGFRVVVDKNDAIEGKYDMCFPNACSAEIDIGAKTLETLKKGQNMAIVMRVPGGDVSGRELTFNVPLKDLGPAFDGKPTDPKVLEQQRQALQQQLQKKAEEQRKALEQQQGAGEARQHIGLAVERHQHRIERKRAGGRRIARTGQAADYCERRAEQRAGERLVSRHAMPCHIGEKRNLRRLTLCERLPRMLERISHADAQSCARLGENVAQ